MCFHGIIHLSAEFFANSGKVKATMADKKTRMDKRVYTVRFRRKGKIQAISNEGISFSSFACSALSNDLVVFEFGEFFLFPAICTSPKSFSP